jgi:CHAT domain-containing protein
MNKDVYQQIIALIDENQVSEGIDVFQNWARTNGKSDLANSLTILKLRYNRVKRQERTGILRLSQALQEYAFVINSTLDFLNSQLVYEMNVEEGSNSQNNVEDELPSKKTILFLASTPTNEAKLQLEKEFTKIHANLQDKGETYVLKAEWAIKPSDLQQAILKHKPYILHFSGHGQKASYDTESGLLLEDKEGKSQLVPASALENMFRIFKQRFVIRVVVFNACYSKTQAQSVKKYIPYVIGMKRQVEDETSLEFSTGFYRGLAEEGEDVEFAFDLAVNAIQLEGLDDDDVPVLLQ